MSKVEMIKKMISDGSYDVDSAVETLAEKAVLVNEVFGSVWGIALQARITKFL